MCCGLAAKGLRVTLVAPVPEAMDVEGVRVLPTYLKGKAARVCGGASILTKLRRIGADVYHFHDPELLPWMFLYQTWTPSTAVIYDVHEYYPEALIDSNFFGWSILNNIMSRVVLYSEPLLARRLRGVIGVTDPIVTRFLGGRARVEVVRNLVTLRAFPAASVPPELPGDRTIVVGGSIDPTRGMSELVEAIALLKKRGLLIHLLCVGAPCPDGYGDQLLALADGLGIGGQVAFKEKAAWEVYQRYVSGSCLGMVLLAPGQNHDMALPCRLCEFMANRLPIIASNFPVVAQVVRDAECGILVDSCRPEVLADGMEYLLTHPEEAARMGANGRQAVEDRYCMERELEVLMDFYQRVLGGGASLGIVPHNARVS
jgi:glycosyltransferase involved in cell wall biosynthesis